MKVGDLISIKKDFVPEGWNRILPKGDLLTIEKIGPFWISCYSTILEKHVALDINELRNNTKFNIVEKNDNV